MEFLDNVLKSQAKQIFHHRSPITSNGNHTEERKLAHGKLGVSHIITGDEPHLPVSLRNDQEAACLGMRLGRER